jgi:phage recombination protein Bet
LGWKAEQIDVIRRSVAKDANQAELYQFLYLSKEYGLDPFKREIYFMKSGNSPTIITGIDGFRKCSKRDPGFEGVVSFAVREGDEFSVDAAAYTVHHKFGAKRGKVIGGWARADAKGRRPVIVYVDFEEFNKGGSTWGKMPGVMIAKVAESHAIRRQFGLAGLYTKEEMGVADSAAPTVVTAPTIDADYTVLDAHGGYTHNPEQVMDDRPDDSATPAPPPAEEAHSDPPPQEKTAAPKPQGATKWAGTVKSLKGLGYSDDDILREARGYFNKPDAESLDDILTTPPNMADFLMRLRDMKQAS